MRLRRLSSILSLSFLALGMACATGAEDGGVGGPAFSGGPGDESGGEETEGEQTDGDEGSPPPADTSADTETADGSDGDDGNPLCCEVRPESGCDSGVTESCVCASRPECCQQVWTQDCVDLAVACGDPYCEGAPPPDDPPPDDPPPDDPPPDDPPPDDPPPDDPPLYEDCPCLMQAGVDNFCHYGPNYPGCPMTAPGGYCDPNGDGSFAEGDWDLGYFEWHAECT